MKESVVNLSNCDARGGVVLLHDQYETSHSKDYDCAVPGRDCDYWLVFWSQFHWIEVQVLEGKVLTLNVGYFVNQNLLNIGILLYLLTAAAICEFLCS